MVEDVVWGVEELKDVFSVVCVCTVLCVVCV